MDNQLSAEKITFDLFLDAIKRKDKMQFSYFNLYFAIKNEEELKQENNNIQTEEMAFWNDGKNCCKRCGAFFLWL